MSALPVSLSRAMAKKYDSIACGFVTCHGSLVLRCADDAGRTVAAIGLVPAPPGRVSEYVSK